MSTTDPDSILEDIAAEFVSCLRAGQNPSIKSFAQQHPSLAGDIADMLSSIALMEQLGRCESESRQQAGAGRVRTPAIQELGDFDILREIGRGGMGVVYEAIDRTLQRRVALKVLSDSALTTQKHVDRFRRESRLAAQLHHTNIVSVFGVGEEDGKHFYAMQYIEGVSIQDILDGLQHLASVNRPFQPEPASPVSNITIAAGLQAGTFADPRSTHVDVKHYVKPNSLNGASSGSTATDDSHGRSSHKISANGSHPDNFSQIGKNGDSGAKNCELPVRGDNCDSATIHESPNARRDAATDHDHTFGPPYWRSVARIGMQVADALHYAHVNGILHRDIKPANLIFDSRGTVWVADFGLAKLTETDDLTNTGDVVGTLKYMAPEQLAGKADARTDIYALGLTLYELLTLQPLCNGETYKDLFTQKQASAHTAPRKINPAIPRDLETIIQKMLEWAPEKRYRSARELSEELHRFLDDVPIRARRIGLAERAWRWCRRNRALATLGATVAGFLVLLPIVLGWAYMRESKQSQRMENTLDVVFDGLDGLFGSYLENDVATTAALTGAFGEEATKLAPAMLTKDTAYVLEKMLVVYDKLAEENAASSNIGLAVESAKARRRVGDLYQQLGQFEKASEAYGEAAERYSELSKRDATYYVDVARVYQATGQLQEQSQDFDLAQSEYEKAIRALQHAPSSDVSRFETARTHYLLGKRRVIEGAGPGHMAGARPHRGPFRNLGRPNRAAGPERRSPRSASIGHMPRLLDDNDRKAHLDAAISQVQLLREKELGNAAYRFLLALCLREIDRLDRVEGKSATNAIELLKELVEQYPSVPRYRFELCATYLNSGRYASDIREDERLQTLQLARELGEELVKEQRDAAPYRINLAHIYAHLGVEHGRLANCQQAERFTRLSIATHKSVTEDFPGLASLSYRLSTNDKTRLGRWLLQLRRYEELVELLQPLGDQLFETLDTGGNEDASHRSARSTLRECRELLIPAYEALDDQAGYIIALAWLDSADHDGPQAGPHFASPPGAGAVAMAMSYDASGDQRITRDEVPTRMAREWFRRFDKDNDGEITLEELDQLLSR